MREIGAISVGADLVGCRMAPHFEVEDFSVSVPNHEEDVKRLERDCSDAEPKRKPCHSAPPMSVDIACSLFARVPGHINISDRFGERR